jgi:hypothetical protein
MTPVHRILRTGISIALLMGVVAALASVVRLALGLG